MKGIDTNVLVRYILTDDPVQAPMAQATVRQAAASGEPVLVSLLTILETEWVLRSAARVSKPALIGVFKGLLECGDVLIENENALEQALVYYEDDLADFADCLMAARYRQLGCSTMLTFDAKAARLPVCTRL
ncbi:MAG: type II toxin-antitoxin system VapC family toxin [Pseudomonadota bacterium]